MLILDLDGTFYPASNPLTRLVDARTETFLIEQAGLQPDELAALEVERPSVLDALNHLGLPRRRWADYVYRGLSYRRFLEQDPLLRTALASVSTPRVVVTIAPITHAQQVMSALGTADMVDQLCSVFDSPHLFKAPIYEQLIGDQDPAQVHVVGDNHRLDLDPADALGCRCFLVGDPQATPFYPAFPTLHAALTTLAIQPRLDPHAVLPPTS